MKNGRSQKRLSVGIPIRIQLPDSVEYISADNQDLSWGGALFTTRDPAVWNDDTLKMTFPWAKDQSFSAEAEIVRRETRQDGSIAVAVRFSTLHRADQTRLDKLLQLMALKEDDMAADSDTPIVETLELDFADNSEMHDMLMQIAHGTLSLIVFRGYRTEQSILLSIKGAGGSPSIQLRARVTEQEPLSCRLTDQAFIKVTLQLEHPTEDLARIAKLKIPHAQTSV